MWKPLRFAPLALASVLVTSCATKGLLSETTDPARYQGVARYEIRSYDHDPRFLVVGDTQSGWRVREKFLNSDCWWTKKAFIFPFYYLYNLGQGIVGTFNYMRQVPDYGGVERRAVRDAVYREVTTTHLDFLLHLGDICMNDGRRPSHWTTYLDESKNDVPLLSTVPVVPVIGNHEHANDETYGLRNYEAVFPETPRFYVVDFPDLALFVIDSNFILDQYQNIDDAEQDRLWREWIAAAPGEPPAWLERELAAHHQRFKVLAMHHPPISMGRHFEDWLRTDWGDNVRAKRARLIELLVDNGVQLVLSGHEHIYQHSTVRLMRNGEESGRLMHVVVTSGAGAPSRHLFDDEDVARCLDVFREDGFDVDLVKNVSAHHYSIVEVAAGALTVKTVEVPGGEVIESVVIGSN